MAESKIRIFKPYFNCLIKKYTDCSGRAGRFEFWAFHLADLFVFLLFAVMPKIFTLFYYIGVLRPKIALLARRAHDTGKSAKLAISFYLLMVFSFSTGLFIFVRGCKGHQWEWFIESIIVCMILSVATLVYLFLMAYRKSLPETNQYGDVPETDGKHEITAAVTAVFSIILALACIVSITGYAMFISQDKAVRAVKQMQEIHRNTKTVFSKRDNYDGLSMEILRRQGALYAQICPDNCINGSGLNTYGGELIIKANQDNTSFVISYKKMPKRVCKAVIATSWGTPALGGFLSLHINGKKIDNIRTAKSLCSMRNSIDLKFK